MNRKKLLVIVGGLGAVSFIGTFAITWLLTPEPEPVVTISKAEEQEQAERSALEKMDSLALEEQRALGDLIREVKQRIETVRRRGQVLDEREKRIEMAREELKKESHALENLRVQLAAPLISLKEMKKELLSTRVQISREEASNLKKTAKIYEKMDGEQGGKIIVGMCTNNQFDDAAKILRYMSEKKAAGLIGEIRDMKLAAMLFDRMKRIREEG